MVLIILLRIFFIVNSNDIIVCLPLNLEMSSDIFNGYDPINREDLMDLTDRPSNPMGIGSLLNPVNSTNPVNRVTVDSLLNPVTVTNTGGGGPTPNPGEGGDTGLLVTTNAVHESSHNTSDDRNQDIRASSSNHSNNAPEIPGPSNHTGISNNAGPSGNASTSSHTAPSGNSSVSEAYDPNNTTTLLDLHNSGQKAIKVAGLVRENEQFITTKAINPKQFSTYFINRCDHTSKTIDQIIRSYNHHTQEGVPVGI